MDARDGSARSGREASPDSVDQEDLEARLAQRVGAVEDFAAIADRIAGVGDLRWAEATADYRLLAINASLRRQIESMNAAVLLSRQGLGHLAVAFVRASVEDVMYLKFFCSMTLEDSQKLFELLGVFDSARSLIAQRAYVGDEVMRSLWYPPGFVDTVERRRDEVRAQLRSLQKVYKWPGGDTPNNAWIAEQASVKDLYEYLHAATSRALHFSAGEIMRRSWGAPNGILVTNKPEFRTHLASFALDQLWRLYIDTWEATLPLVEDAGIATEEGVGFEELHPVLERLLALGKVPLVHAHEWNLTPDGPLFL